MKWPLLLAGVASLAGCAVNLADPNGRACDPDHGCNAGTSCHLGKCVSLDSCPTCIARAGTLLPLYTYPTDSSWQALIDAKAAHPTVPVMVIVNPNSGPGTAPDPNFVSGTARLRGAGVVALGYVYTTQAQRPEADVQSDIAKYRAFYPDMQGILFDQQKASPGAEDYYRRLSGYARSQGLVFTVGSPGDDPSPSYEGTVDLLVIYIGAGVPPVASLGGWHQTYPSNEFGIMAYGVQALDTSFVQSAKSQVGFIYLTQDLNTWQHLPPYFNDLLSALAQ